MKTKIALMTLFFATTQTAWCKGNYDNPNLLMSNKDFKTTVTGTVTKSDNEFLYLKVAGARSLVKIPKKYALNHPTRYPKDLVVKLDLPFTVFASNNLKVKEKVAK